MSGCVSCKNCSAESYLDGNAMLACWSCFAAQRRTIQQQAEQITELTEYKEIADWFNALVTRAQIGTPDTPSLKAYIEQLEAQNAQQAERIKALEETNCIAALALAERESELARLKAGHTSCVDVLMSAPFLTKLAQALMAAPISDAGYTVGTIADLAETVDHEKVKQEIVNLRPVITYDKPNDGDTISHL